MPKLPVISGKDLIKILEKNGHFLARQKGSHVRMRHNDFSKKPVTVPLHNNIKIGLLHAIMKDAELTIEDFI